MKHNFTVDLEKLPLNISVFKIFTKETGTCILINHYGYIKKGKLVAKNKNDLQR